MRKIECVKVSKKDNPSDFLYEYFKLDCPATRYSDTKVYQCKAGKARSIGDLFWLTKSYYPDIEFEEFFVRLHTTLYDHFYTKMMLWCSDINDVTVWSFTERYEDDYIEDTMLSNSYHYRDHIKKTELCGYSINSLKEILFND